jgi:hypothetical protein
LQGIQKYIKSGFFGMKIDHLAALLWLSRKLNVGMLASLQHSFYFFAKHSRNCCGALNWVDTVFNFIQTARRHFLLMDFNKIKDPTQSCQIFTGAIYQNGENVPNNIKHIKWPQNTPNGHIIPIPNGHKIHQLSVKGTKLP